VLVDLSVCVKIYQHHTIKQGALIKQFGHLVPLGVEKLCIAYRPSAHQ
jgi:hypothetical protein